MTTTDKYEYCNLTDEKEIIEFEKALFKAFSKRDPEGWIPKNYDTIDNCRFKPKGLNYQDIKVFCIKQHENIIAGSATNFNVNHFLFIDKGFQLNQETIRDKKIVEGLNMFVDEDIQGQESMSLGFSLFDYVVKNLKEIGISIMFGTCYKKLKASYILLGWELIDSKVVEGKEMLFFQYKIQ